jgi:hypothetical protein
MQHHLLLMVLALATFPFQAQAADSSVDHNRGLAGLASAVAEGAQRHKLKIQTWHPTPGDLEKQLLFRSVVVKPNGAVAIDGLSFPDGNKRLVSGVTSLLEALKSSNLRGVRLVRLTWEPYGAKTVAAFELTGTVILLNTYPQSR